MPDSIGLTVQAYTARRHILCRPLPLSACRIRMPRLLERAGLSAQQDGTVFMMAVPYLVCADADNPDRNLSLYAVPRDYHLFFREMSNELIPLLQKQFPDYHFAVFTDHSPLAEAEAAEASGLGEVGMNGLLLTEEYGSFVFIGELISDVPFDVAVDTQAWPSKGRHTICTRCGLCMKACPAACQHDRQNCLSALTQKKGILQPDEQERLARHPLVWGCDICQTACPVNRRVLAEKADTPIPFFREERMLRADAQSIAALSDEAFSDRTFSWRGRNTILRNIAIHNNIHDSKKGGRPS